MTSTVCVFLALSTVLAATLAEDSDVTAPKKKAEELWYLPFTGLIFVKFKLLLIAFLVLTGTASITKFIAGLIHILANACKSKPKPVYIKYESPSYGHYHAYDKPYYGDNDFYHHSKNAVDRAIRNIEGPGKEPIRNRD